ncbi:MAG: MFS transporter [Candidatus Lokiarchaeota archaeon]|nr:MFS transporter [Candidatus Lokiarchaeota archaeon]
MKKKSIFLLFSAVANNISYTCQFYFANIKAGELIDPIVSSLMTGIFFGTLAIFGLIIGKLSDHFRRRRIFGIIGCMITAIIYFQYYYSSTIFQFLLLSSLIGIFIAFSNSTIPALFSEKEPKMKKGKLMSIYNAVLCLGWASGILLGEFFSYYFLDLNYFILGSFSIVSGIILFFVKDEFNKSKKNFYQKNDKIRSNSHYKHIKSFLLILVIILAFRQLSSLGAYSSMANYLGLYLNATDIERGIISSSDYIFAIIFMIPMGIIVDKIGRKNGFIIGTSLTIIAIIGFGIIISPWHILIFYMLGAMAWASMINSSNAYVLDITNQSERARGMGYLSAGLSIGGTLGPFMQGLLLYLTGGNFRMSFLIISIFLIPSLSVSLLIKEDKKNHLYKIFNKISNNEIQVENSI